MYVNRVDHVKVSSGMSPEDFRRHYRMDRQTFRFILNRIRSKLQKQSSMARNSGLPNGGMTPKQMLGSLLKHLGGSSPQDIEFMYQFHRSTIQKNLYRTMKILVEEFPIPVFPFNDQSKLEKMAADWRRRSAGGLFNKCVGAFDGYLLRISKSCVHKHKVSNPQKYFCRKGFYAVNCQVCCDSHRRITWMSLSHPGACPDVVAYKQSVMCRAVENGLLPDEFYFIGDAAYPSSNQMLTPFNKPSLKKDVRRDGYNFYLSQLRIHIECVFGILVNRFPILQQQLKCKILENAMLTFHTCAVLHNILVNRRIRSFNTSPTNTRLTQIPNHQRVTTLNPGDFREVPEVDETTADDICSTIQTNFDVSHTSDNDSCTESDIDNIVNRRDSHVDKIYQAGYVRPKTTKWQRLTLQL